MENVKYDGLLGLDLGTKTGWAYRSVGGQITSGTWLLATEKELLEQRQAGLDRWCDVRPCRLFEKVLNLAQHAELVVFEDVLFSSSTAQTQLWSSLRSAVWCAAYYIKKMQGIKVELRGVPVQTLKIFATGRGDAGKDLMAKALNYRGKGDDNKVDAIWLLKFAESVERKEREFVSLFANRKAKKEKKISRLKVFKERART